MEKINQLKNLYEKDQKIDKELEEINKSKEYFLKKQGELKSKLKDVERRKATSDLIGKQATLETME